MDVTLTRTLSEPKLTDLDLDRRTESLPKRVGSEPIDGKRVLISGGTTGIGRATACLLAADGANVLVFGRHEAELKDAIEDIETVAKGLVVGITADQTKQDEVDKVFEEVDKHLGGLDILINNAGVGADSMLESEYPEWEYVLHTNFLGYVACARKAIDRMRKAGKGHIINIGSVNAFLREEDDQIYGSSKAAIQAFSESLRKQMGKENIKVTLIEPGTVGTDMVAEKYPPEVQTEKEAKGEMLMAEDLAECIRYILRQPDRVLIDQVRITPIKETM